MIALVPDRFPNAKPVTPTIAYTYVAAGVDKLTFAPLYRADGSRLMFRCFVPLHARRRCIEVRS